MGPDERPRITLESRKPLVECLVCNSTAASDCQDLARVFAEHFTDGAAVAGREALLRRINNVEEWVVCDHCQSTLSGEDKMRLMSLWMVLEGLRNWLRTEVCLGLKGMLPSPPPVQLA